MDVDDLDAGNKVWYRDKEWTISSATPEAVTIVNDDFTEYIGVSRISLVYDSDNDAFFYNDHS